MRIKLASAAVAVVLLATALSATIWYKFFLNRFQIDGELVVSVLDQPVTVRRDSYGIPYIRAESFADLIRAQGFVTAQDRILQAELYRRSVKGEMAALIGVGALNSDIRARVSGYYQAAQRHVPKLSDDARNFLTWYVEGINAFMETGSEGLPLELGLMGIVKPKPWTIEDALAIYYFGGSIHGTNIRSELLSQAIREELGQDTLDSLQPVNVNPDRTVGPLKSGYESDRQEAATMHFNGIAPFAEGAPPLFGSNNWAIGPEKSSSGRAILSSDPHLDSRRLPGFMHPIGLFAPGINSIGITMAGMPGLLIGRTDHVAFGATNAYGDSQDVYIETQDPNNSQRYMEGNVSVAFDNRTEVIRVKKDGSIQDHVLNIRSTKRGPVISDHEVFGVGGDTLMTARWATAEQQNAELGIDRFLTAKNVDELEQAIFNIDLMFFNFVFADSAGNIGQRASGLIPTRVSGGATPSKATQSDNWSGFIPKDEMPGGRNPERNWIGTANHDTRGDAYPYYYASEFAPHYRYSRMKEVLDGPGKLTAEDNWRLMLDTRNTLAVRLAPLMADWLRVDPETRQLADLLDNWNHLDDSDSVGATVFHVVYERMVGLTFADEMSPGLLKQFVRSRYFWQQRFDDALMSGEPAFFDDTRTAEKESAGDITIQAGRAALAMLHETFGADSDEWIWGRASRMTFVSPLRQRGVGRDLLGGGEYPGRGSHETINRGGFDSRSFPYEISFIASARMVFDFADDEKVMAVVPGGNTARQGHPWTTSQLGVYVQNGWIPWWRDEDRIIEHAEHTLKLLPAR